MSDETRDPNPELPQDDAAPQYDSAALKRARSAVDAVPDRIGRYRILERIGGGGMGEVYRAEQRTPVRREVAIKLIKMGMDTKLVIARFEAERQALAMMDHPNIAKVHDADADETGRPYFVMEYVKGKPITEYADANHLTINERLTLFEQVCHAIQHAHHKGIIHRDLKPSNVLVSTQDGRPHAKVIDFGIAKATNQRLTDMTLYTQHDQFIGTPQYMSPEQADGSLDIDTRTDVYSLGVLLYELLTGSTPFGGEDIKAAAMEQIKKMIREIDPPKPSTRLHMSTLTLPSLAASRRVEPKKLGTLMRGELDWIVMKALEKDRVRRYDTPTSLVEDVERFLNGTAVKAAPPSWAYRTRKLVRRNKAPILVTSIILVLLCVGLIGISTGLIRAKAALSREQDANLRESNAHNDALTQAYVANIVATQVAMKAENWPEARQRIEACPEAQRGWEWRLLKTQSSAPEFGFAQPVYFCQLTRNGKYMLCMNGTAVQLVDLATRLPCANLTIKEITNADGGTTWTFPSVAEDGRIAAQWDQGVIMYDPAGNKLATIDAAKSDDTINTTVLTPSGDLLLIVRGSTTWLYSTRTRQNLCRLNASDLAAITFSPDEHWMAYNVNGVATIVDTRSGKTVQTIQPDAGDSFISRAFSPDLKQIALGSTKGSIKIFDTEHWAPIKTLAGEAVTSQHLEYSPDGAHLLSADYRKGYRIWDLSSGKAVALLKRNLAIDSRYPACFSTDGERVLDHYLGVIWNWKLGDDESTAFSPADGYDARGFTGDGSTLVTVDNGCARVWKTDRPSLHYASLSVQPNLDDTPTPSIRFGNTQIKMANWNSVAANTVRAVLNQQPGAEQGAVSVTASDKRWNASALGDHEVLVQDPATMKPIAMLSTHEKRIRCIAISPDGQRLVTGSDDCSLRFWDTTTWKEMASIRRRAGIVNLAFTADGTRLVASCADRSVFCLDTRDAHTRRVEQDSEAAERKRQVVYVTSLVDEAPSGDNVPQSILANTSLSVEQKVAALAELHSQLSVADTEAGELFVKLKADALSKKELLAAIPQMSVPKLTRASLIQFTTRWQPDAKEQTKKLLAMIARPGQSTQRYADATAEIDALAAATPNDFNLQLAGATARYRTGDFESAVSRCQASLGNTKKVATKSALSDMNAVLALSLFQLGKRQPAESALDSSIRDYRRFSNESLQFEAAALIRPASTRPAANGLAKTDGVGSAADSQYVASLRAKVGKVVEVRGKLAAAFPTYTGGHMNLVLEPADSGLLVFVLRKVNDQFEDGYATALIGHELVVRGTVEIYLEGGNRGVREEWRGRVQVTVSDRANFVVVDEAPALAPTPTTSASTQAASSPATAPAVAKVNEPIDSTNAARLTAAAGKAVRLKGKIVLIRPTSARDALNILMEPEDSGPLIWIDRTAKPAFDATAGGDFAGALAGQTVVVTGKLGTYGGLDEAFKGRPQIALSDPSQLQIISATTQPTAP